MLRTAASGDARPGATDKPLGHPFAPVRWVCALLCLVTFVDCGRAPEAHPVLTSVGEIRQLRGTQTRLGVPVRLEGVVTYFDGASDDCFVSDSGGGIRVKFAPGQVVPATGWRVEVTGFAGSGGNAPSVIEGRLRALRPDTLPQAVPINGAQLSDPRFEYRRVAITGVVQSVSSPRPGLVTLEVRTEGSIVWATIPASTAAVTDDWLDAEVQATGVLAQSFDDKASGREARLWMANASGMDSIRQPTPLAALPVSNIRTLLALPRGHSPLHRVRLQGAPYIPLTGGMGVRDASGQMPVRMGPIELDPNTRVLDLAGFVTWDSGQPVLAHAVPVGAVEGESPDRLPVPGSILTKAIQVHQLTLAAAQRAYPVRLRAVVTYFDPYNHILFVQDSSDGIFVELSLKESVTLRAGDDVEVNGITTADFAPDVAKARVKVLGHSRLPAPVEGRFGGASWGREDCRWLQFEGVVQHVAQGRGDTLLTLAWGKNRFRAHVLAPVASLAHLLDTDVALQGVCGALFNSKHQMLGVQMFVPGAECIRVRPSPPPASYATPPVPIASLLQFSGAHDMGHRARLRGTVTYANRFGATWVSDASGGIMVQDHDATGLAAGDQVDVLGFPQIAGFSPALVGAEVRRAYAGTPPAPVRITADEAMKGTYDNQLVQIEGRLVDRLQQPAEQVLVISSGETIFTASLAGTGAARKFESGTRLRLTGICTVEVEQAQDLILPHTFRLLLRSPADIEVLGLPPLLTAGRVIPILAGGALLMIAALLWVALLRKRVRSQTFALRAQTIQLQSAHQRTREALQKACEAESLDLDSRRILEMIARDEPVDLIVDHLAESVALHCEGGVCVILLGPPYGPRTSVVPAMPPAWLDVFAGLDLKSVSFSGEYRKPTRFSSDPAWRAFLDSQRSTRFQAFCSAAIVVDGSAAGVIAAFFRDDKKSTDAQDAQLGLWCNIAALALERRKLHDQLSYRAQHDGLTGLPNRALLYERLEEEIGHASRSNNLLGVLFIDLDGFKQINDTHGHDVGDVVLREAARRLTHGIRRGDTVARIGGDEFVVLLPLLSSREDAVQIADKIATALREPFFSNHHRLSLSASVGIGIWPLDGDRADPLLRFADAQMYGEKKRRWYEAKAAGLLQNATRERVN